MRWRLRRRGGLERFDFWARSTTRRRRRPNWWRSLRANMAGCRFVTRRGRPVTGCTGRSHSWGMTAWWWRRRSFRRKRATGYRRDALALVTQFRAGELTAVWVPDPHHEAMRDLTRARQAAVEDLRRKRQQTPAVWPINTDRRPCEDKDSPRRTFGYAVKYANQSLITDVSRLRPHRCTII